MAHDFPRPFLSLVGLAKPAGLLALLLGAAGCAPSAEPLATTSPGVDAEADREYRLSATMLGYIGIGGEIDGQRNPILTAEQGERVAITLVNGELMVHDIRLEEHGVASEQILQEGAITHLVFTAEMNDTYYCTVPGHREAGMAGEFRLVDGPKIAGVLPGRADRALNLDLEAGTLEDWTATGDAFDDQPVEGDVVAARRDDSKSGHAGSHWIGTYEVHRDVATGTLTSQPFEITHPFAAFRVGGGAHPETRVELLLAGREKPFFSVSGLNQEEMRPVVVELEEHLGREMLVRVVDEETGSWGHINFDDFLFYERRPTFSNERSLSETLVEALPPLDIIAHAGLSAEEAVEVMTLPEGFSVDLAAAEPDVVRPIAMALDDRGRVWIAEGHTYPIRAPEGEGNDRILIFEDTDGDGSLDSRKIFMEGLNLVSGLEVGFDGVWVGAAPYLLFFPIAEDGESPAGPPEILLDGWGFQDTHETLNGFIWGPDGWLYGCHGVFTHSRVGKPGTPDEERQPLNAGFWRYHPLEHRFEVVAHGTSNPWGIDFDDHGEAFATVCVIPHLFHVIPGARYQRQSGNHFDPDTYDDIQTIADHVHWVGNQGPHRANRRSDSAGGGHAHAGAMIYLGGHWPKEYRNRLFMNNIHGFRSNTDILERRGSGYIGRHGPDFIKTNDSWSQGLNFRYGPGGSVYWTDWYDKNQCHSNNPDVHDKTLGRIYRIRHENDRWEPVNLAQKESSELVRLQLHENDWYVRHARRLLQERGPDPEVHTALREILDQSPDVTRQLRALWALHVTHGMDEEEKIARSESAEEHVRAWSVRLLGEDKNPSSAALTRLATMAAEDESALVRLYLASALQRLPLDERWEILANLSRRSEDAADANIPLLLWYAAEPLIPQDPERAIDLALQAEVSRFLSFSLRRICSLGEETARPLLTAALDQARDGARRALIQEALQALREETEAAKAAVAGSVAP